jgi:hypothetical protein
MMIIGTGDVSLLQYPIGRGHYTQLSIVLFCLRVQALYNGVKWVTALVWTCFVLVQGMRSAATIYASVEVFGEVHHKNCSYSTTTTEQIIWNTPLLAVHAFHMAEALQFLHF